MDIQLKTKNLLLLNKLHIDDLELFSYLTTLVQQQQHNKSYRLTGIRKDVLDIEAPRFLVCQLLDTMS